jgi:hypothetical protein
MLLIPTEIKVYSIFPSLLESHRLSLTSARKFTRPLPISPVPLIYLLATRALSTGRQWCKM